MRPIAVFLTARFSALADPDTAAPMAAYMKSEMPFWGIKKPDRVPVLRALRDGFRPTDRADYEANVLALWALPHREDRYAAIDYAKRFKAHIVPASLPLYERMIREGAWWDFVDDVAGNLVCGLMRTHRAETQPVMERWIEDEDVWIRRSALLSQLKLKEETDEELLFRFCRARMHEPEFFIRKAIGWALRQHSYVAPDAVEEFLRAHRGELSGLSFREGNKALKRLGRGVS